MSDLWRDTMVAGFRDTIMQILLVLPRLLALLTFLALGLVFAWLVSGIANFGLADLCRDALGCCACCSAMDKC